MKCPLCKKKLREILTRTLRGGKKGLVYHCPHCQHGVLYDKRTAEELKEFYDTEYRKTHKPDLTKTLTPAELFTLESPLLHYRIELIKPKLHKNMHLLDIGCSAGMFLYDAKPYVKEMYGIDYDSRSAQFAAKKCKCQVFTDDINRTPLKPGSLDIITMFHSLEHVKKPLEFLRQIKKYLKPNGLLYVEVPNLHDSLLHAYDLPNYKNNFYFHDAHLSYFSGKSLKKIMQQAGFQGKIYYSQDYNFPNHFYWIHHDNPQRTGAIGRGIPKLPLRKGLENGKKKALSGFIEHTDAEYKKLLSKLGITSNISFIGKLK